MVLIQLRGCPVIVVEDVEQDVIVRIYKSRRDDAVRVDHGRTGRDREPLTRCANVDALAASIGATVARTYAPLDTNRSMELYYFKSTKAIDAVATIADVDKLKKGLPNVEVVLGTETAPVAPAPAAPAAAPPKK